MESSEDGSTITVTDIATGLDGVNILRHIERLQFQDQSIVFGGSNGEPEGLLTISADTPTEDQLLTVSALGVIDLNNVTGTNPTGAITGPITYYWQGERTGGTFFDILVDNGVTLQAATGTTFRPGDLEVGLTLRVRAVYQDASGVVEEVFSAVTGPVANVNDAPIGALLINDTTPTETQALVAVNAFTDADVDNAGIGAGVPPPIVYHYQWQQSAAGGGATFTNIAGATAQTFTPGQAQVNRQLRVVVTYASATSGNGATGVTVNLSTAGAQNTLNAGTDTLSGIENIIGSAFNDTLTGTTGANVMDGGAGNDSLSGLAGADTLVGGAGNDTLTGGAGNDSPTAGSASTRRCIPATARITSSVWSTA